MTTIDGYHFAGKTLRDGRPLPRKGETITHDGEVVPCPDKHALARGAGGLHASERVIDALAYAPGWMVARVRLSGTIAPHGDPIDKYAASERTNLTDYVDASDVLVQLSRVWALRALRVAASGALRRAGLHEHADTLANLSDDCNLCAAQAAARAAGAAGAAGAAARAAAGAARAAAWAAGAAGVAERAAGAAQAAARAAWAAGAAGVAERATQERELTGALEKLWEGQRK